MNNILREGMLYATKFTLYTTLGTLYATLGTLYASLCYVVKVIISTLYYE